VWCVCGVCVCGVCVCVCARACAPRHKSLNSACGSPQQARAGCCVTAQRGPQFCRLVATASCLTVKGTLSLVHDACVCLALPAQGAVTGLVVFAVCLSSSSVAALDYAPSHTPQHRMHVCCVCAEAAVWRVLCRCVPMYTTASPSRHGALGLPLRVAACGTRRGVCPCARILGTPAGRVCKAVERSSAAAVTPHFVCSRLEAAAAVAEAARRHGCRPVFGLAACARQLWCWLGHHFVALAALARLLAAHVEASACCNASSDTGPTRTNNCHVCMR
jgi:hypothetical protein